MADRLTQIVETAGIPGSSPVIELLRCRPRVAVTGRAGVGRRTLVRALRHRGVVVVADGEPSDLLLLVVAEVAKPEDLAVLRAARRPALVVSTKADLAGRDPGGPLAVARRRAAALRATTGVRVVPVVGLLAALDPSAELDRDLVAALQSLTTHPADLRGVDAFVQAPHPVDADVRRRLLATLDRFGIAHAVVALSRGMPPHALPAHLHGLSNLAEAITALDATAAAVRHRRVLEAVAELRCRPAHDTAVAALLASDDTVLALMAAAVDVVQADGLTVDRGDTAAAHRARALRWHRYGRGPVGALHARCAADIVRGSLRLLELTDP